jgi:hypothetical protein
MFQRNNLEKYSDASPRILGMKPWQAAVMGIFLFLDFVVVAVGGYLVLSATPPAGQAVVAPPSAPTQTTAPTEEPSPSPVPTETIQSLADLFPTYTPAGTDGDASLSTTSPSDAGSGGWVDYTSEQLALQLPDSYAAGNTKSQAAIVMALKSKGADFNWTDVEKLLRGATSDTILIGIDSRSGAPPIFTSLQFLYMPVDPEAHMSDIVTGIIGGMAGTTQLVEQRQINNKFYEVEQVTLSLKDPALSDELRAVYVIKDSDVILEIICTTSTDEWQSRQTEFDQIVRTLQILHPSS